MHQCPYCRSAERQVKSGFNRSGSQRLQCRTCRRQYTPAPLPLGYDDKTREAALKLYLEGDGFRHRAESRRTRARIRMPVPGSLASAQVDLSPLFFTPVQIEKDTKVRGSFKELLDGE